MISGATRLLVHPVVWRIFFVDEIMDRDVCHIAIISDA